MHQLLWLPVIIIPHFFPFLIELAYYVLFIDSFFLFSWACYRSCLVQGIGRDCFRLSHMWRQTCVSSLIETSKTEGMPSIWMTVHTLQNKNSTYNEIHQTRVWWKFFISCTMHKLFELSLVWHLIVGMYTGMCMYSLFLIFSMFNNLYIMCFMLIITRWKDPENEFRKSVFKLTEIPTLIEYGTVSIGVFLISWEKMSSHTPLRAMMSWPPQPDLY